MIKPIEGYEGYFITDDGKVISHKFKKPRVMKGMISHNNYRYIDLCKNNHVARFAVHRLVGQYFVEGYFEGAVINHIDGNTLNNHYTNLEWITQKENINKGYITSGLGPLRNYCYHTLIFPNGEKVGPFKGNIALKNYIENNNLNTSYTMLIKNKHSRGFNLISINKKDIE